MCWSPRTEKSELANIISEGYERTEIQVNGFEVYEHEKGRCVLYDPVNDYVRPFIEQNEYDAEG